jgi:hypothetical protein
MVIQPFVILKPGNDVLVKHFNPTRGIPTPKNMNTMDSCQWFIHGDPSDGVDIHENDRRLSYGQEIMTYHLKENLKLINLGSREARDAILNSWRLPSSALDPDRMYQGDHHNTKVHEAMRDSNIGSVYHGTYIDGDNPVYTDSYSEDWFGAQEVVLWKDFQKTLRIRSSTYKP